MNDEIANIEYLFILTLKSREHVFVRCGNSRAAFAASYFVYVHLVKMTK